MSPAWFISPVIATSGCEKHKEYAVTWPLSSHTHTRDDRARSNVYTQLPRTTNTTPPPPLVLGVRMAGRRLHRVSSSISSGGTVKGPGEGRADFLRCGRNIPHKKLHTDSYRLQTTWAELSRGSVLLRCPRRGGGRYIHNTWRGRARVLKQSPHAKPASSLSAACMHPAAGKIRLKWEMETVGNY